MNTNENIWLFLGGIGAIVLVGFIMHPALGILLLLGSIPLTLWLNASNWSITTTKSSPIDPKKDSESQDNQSSITEANEPQNSESQNSGSFTGGIFLILFINFLVFCFGGVLLAFSYGKSNFILLFLGTMFSVMIGLGQLTYVIPWVIKLKKSGKSMLAKGITTGAIITALLTGGCYLTLVMGHLPSMMIYLFLSLIPIVLLIAIPISMHRKIKRDDDKHNNS